ncbi:MAG TPA: cytochrome c3 family protein [Longimicrobiales bacterium]|nr:cytochrome c3 family protein [Longimicrobiales bacterium]
MKRTYCRSFRAVLVLAVASAVGCEPDVVYRDPVLYDAPPAGAGDFLGYSAAATKRTVCGNCHIGKQREWEETAHADAWATLAQSGAMQPLCQECHTVSSRGNVVATPSVGWPATQNARYRDVQCEACHGPGLLHVMNPDARGNRPLAPVAVAADPAWGCGQCHSGAHRPYAEEWAGSLHARQVGSRSTNVNCIGCHEAKGVLRAWGVKSTILEETTDAGHMAITCVVCHDPHDARNSGQLRFPMDVPSVQENLCMKCHQRRGTPDLASQSAGPHSPEGPLLLGEAGWLPPNFEYPAGALVGSHGSDRNPRLCATCHVTDYQVHDPITSASGFRATGHSFQAIPCVDDGGVPTGERSCEMTQRSFRSCTSCHLTETAARAALSVAEMRISRLAGEIGSMLPRIAASEFSNTDNRYTTAEGARFNMQLAQKKGSVAHNPFLLEALLLASIRQIEIDYGIRPSAAVSLQAELTQHD